jgi:hypothetical protein
MAHFAKIGKGNIVEQIIVISNEDAPNEQAGQDFIKKTYNDSSLWLQTSYNTKAGVHALDGTPFRMNYAEIDGTYDVDRDAFIPFKQFPSFIFDEETCTWKPPIDPPSDSDSVKYVWDETVINWRIYGS